MKIRVLGIEVEIVNRRRAIPGNCQGCFWWDLQYQAPGETKGHCHRLAPCTDHIGRTLWPRTNAEQRCGQWRVAEPKGAAKQGGGK